MVQLERKVRRRRYEPEHEDDVGIRHVHEAAEDGVDEGEDGKEIERRVHHGGEGKLNTLILE